MANERARALQSNLTIAERRLWYHLRPLKADGFHFRCQVPIDHLIVDFACFSARLVMEVDSGQHNFEKGRAIDAKRDAYLKRNDFKVLRFWNNEVLQNIGGVMHVIRETLGSNAPTPTPPRSHPTPQAARGPRLGEGLTPARASRARAT
jgi:very-short-patch-repair endonuclease